MPARLRIQRESLQSPKIIDRSQPARRSNRLPHRMLAPLIMSWRTETPRRRRFQFNPLQKTVKRQIKIQPRLFSVGHHIQPRRELIMQRHNHRILHQLLPIRRPKLIQIPNRILQPSRKRIAPNHRRSQWSLFHISIVGDDVRSPGFDGCGPLGNRRLLTSSPTALSAERISDSIIAQFFHTTSRSGARVRRKPLQTTPSRAPSPLPLLRSALSVPFQPLSAAPQPPLSSS